VRKKYACPACETNGENPRIETAAKPETAIDKGLAGPGLLAYIVTSKFAEYVPLYRLEDIFARQGFEIARATQSVWCGDVGDLVEPLYALMGDKVRDSHVVATDDTIMPMLSKNKTANARMWVYVGDDAHPYNVFDFTLNRGRDGPKYFLKDYNQVLLADGYGGYNGVVAGNGIVRAGCWAHLRRKIIDAEKAAPEIADEAIALVSALYVVEKQAKDASVEERLRLRLEQSEPVLTTLRERFLAWKEQLLPKHPMAEAVNYALGQWAELNVFSTDGAVPIDNNVSEREMKRVILNRKNSLFVGNARGGRTAAILASLTSTCRRHGCPTDGNSIKKQGSPTCKATLPQLRKTCGSRNAHAVSAHEFLRRFLLHVLPGGLVRIRHFGLFANRRRSAALERCRKLLGVTACIVPPEPPRRRCPNCTGIMLVVERLTCSQLYFHPSLVPAQPRRCSVDSS